MTFSAIPTDERRKARALQDNFKAEKAITNKQFNALDAAGKRVAIAKDVLLWLKEGKLAARAGTYVRVFNAPKAPLQEYGLDSFSGAKVRNVNGHSCHACALGGIFATAVERGATSGGISDAVTHPELSFQPAMHALLGDVFDAGQLCLIECAFERNNSFGTERDEDTPTTEERTYAWRFGEAVADAAPEHCSQWDIDARVMRAIMHNIIDNGGTFIP